MNDLIRPSLYNAHHEIIHVYKDAKNDVQNDGECWDIVGPICETGDFLGKNRFLNLQDGDLLGMCICKFEKFQTFFRECKTEQSPGQWLKKRLLCLSKQRYLFQ